MPITPYPHTCLTCGTEFLSNASRFKYCSPACRAAGRNARLRLGRARGETHGSAKLTEQRVRQIRAQYAAGGISMRDLASQFGVGYSVVWNIVRRKHWTHVD